MNFSVIIPARYASTRLPGKPLVDIAGKPMIQHVYERAVQSSAERVIIATDDERVADVAAGFTGDVVMTAATHESGTDRLQEVVAALGLSDDECVVNVQGDEPLIPPAVIDQVAALLAASNGAGIATLIESLDSVETLFDPNAVKVVRDAAKRVLYFSRAPVPWCRDAFVDADKQLPKQLPAGVPFYRHIGIYAYRVGFLHQFVSWPPGVLEQAEKLEQLRAMEHGVSIVAEEACAAIPGGIDTEADLAVVRQIVEAAGDG